MGSAPESDDREMTSSGHSQEKLATSDQFAAFVRRRAFHVQAGGWRTCTSLPMRLPSVLMSEIDSEYVVQVSADQRPLAEPCEYHQGQDQRRAKGGRIYRSGSP